jgi:3-oxoacyl-[acyl-carrier-protein] synthase-3
MSEKIHSIITATGSCIPRCKVRNEFFLQTRFYQPDGQIYDRPNPQILEKFEEITEIRERRYVPDDLVASDIAFFAAEDALISSNTDKESLDYIIVAHNFGDVKVENKRSDIVPSLASRVKQKLGIINPATIAYDICFGCPGWLQGVIQANYFLKSGDAKRALVIGAETLSRVSDPHDRDSMLYADGAGAVVLQALIANEPTGILAHAMRSDTIEHACLLKMGLSNNPHYGDNELFLKMNGHKLYEYSLCTVPGVVMESLKKAGVSYRDVKKILLHQANAKMDMAIVKRLFKLFDCKEIPPDILPMTISELGNSSVATIPTLLDMILKGELKGHDLERNDIIIFASVGAGMNINSMVYKMP